MNRFVNVQGRGVIALPPDIRRRHGLDEPGAQVEIVERPDGVIELRPHTAIPVLSLDAGESLVLAELLRSQPRPNARLAKAAAHRRSRAGDQRSVRPSG